MKTGIRDTKEALVGCNEVGVFVASVLKDGMQLGPDFGACYEKLVNDPEFKQKILDAYNGIQNVPTELLDVDVFESLELAKTQVDYLPRYMEALKRA